MRVTQWLRSTLAFVLVSSCVSMEIPSQTPESNPTTTADLLQDYPLAAGAELPDLSKVDVLELSPLMIEFLDRWVDQNQGEYFRLRSLLYAIMGDGTFELVYEAKTRTAQETFLDQRGNCLSFTNMFIAMARYLNLNASFQEVVVPPDWSLQNETLVLSKHINVHLDMRTTEDQVVDFNNYDFRSSYEMEDVSDNRGRAHYFNNIGVERMLEGDTPLAFANFRESIREDHTFSPVWVNLGTLYNREGYLAYAETAYLEALKADRSNLVAMSNLAGIYEQRGQLELAAQYQLRIDSHRMQNPYYRYQLAREAFENGDNDTAIDHLKYAIRKNRYDDNFYFLMSLIYLKNGENQEAQNWMKKAEQVAEMDADKRRYHNKLDLLRSSETSNQTL